MNTNRNDLAGMLRVAVAGVLLGWGSASAAPSVLDVNIGPMADPRYLIQPRPQQPVAQSFTVGTAGYLNRVELQIGRNEGVMQPLILEVLAVGANGVPLFNSTPLAATSMPAAAFPIFSFDPNAAYVPIDLQFANLPVSVGQKLAFRLTTTQPYPFLGAPAYIWTSSPQQDSYPGGDGWYVNTQLNDWSNQVPYDNMMRTYVTIPEPSSAILFVSLLGWVARRRAT